MKVFLLYLSAFFLVFTPGRSQNFVTHLSGSQNVNGVNVTVVPNGVATTSTFCNGGPYWIGNGMGAGPGSYTFIFGTPVTRVKMIFQAINVGEVNCITINGSPYPILPVNFSPLTNNCGFQTVALLQNGCLTETTNNNVSGCEIEITFCAGIDSITIENNGLVSGTVFSMEYKLDNINNLLVGSNGPVCIGNALNLSMITPYILGATYSWVGPAGYNTGSIVNPNVTIPNPTQANSGIYTLTVSNVCTTVTASVNVQVVSAPVFSSVDVFHPTTCNGNDGVIVLHGLGPNTTYTVQFDFNGTPQLPLSVTTDANGNLLLSGLQAGVYDNITAGVGNCITAPSGPHTLINGPFTITGTPADISICNANDGSITVSGLVPGMTYSVNYDLNGIQQPTITLAADISGTIVISGLSAGIYDNIALVNGNCLSDTIGAFNINDPALPPPVANSNSPICEGGDLQLTANGSPGATYSWTGPGTFTSASQNPLIDPAAITDAGTYVVVASLNGCTSAPATVNVVVNPLPSAPVTTNITYCQNAPAAPLTATGQDLLWYDSAVGGTGVPSLVPSTSGIGVTTYYVSQTVNGCEGPRAGVDVTIGPPIDVDLISSKIDVCKGDTVTVMDTYPTVPGNQYTWDLANGKISNSFNNGYTLSWTTEGIKNISLTVTGGGCTTIRTIQVTVHAPSAPYFHLQEHACIGEEVYLPPATYDGSDPEYVWSFDGPGRVIGTEAGPYRIVWTDTGTKLVQLTIPGICSTHHEQEIMVHQPPGAQIMTHSDRTVCAGEILVLSAAPDDGSLYYSWKGADIQGDYNSAVVEAMIDRSGSIVLEVLDKYGCASLDSVHYELHSCCDIFVPSAFSPNGDGKNDVFRPNTKGFRNYTTLRIMNRWGQEVFASDSRGNGWDGTFKGTMQEAGTYTYYLLYYCDDAAVEKKGTLMLVR